MIKQCIALKDKNDALIMAVEIKQKSKYKYSGTLRNETVLALLK